MARLPPRRRDRRLAHRRDGQDRRPVLLLQGDPARARPAPAVVPARRPRGRRHEHRPGRLRRRRDGRDRPQGRPRRPGVPPRRVALGAVRRGAQRVREGRPRTAAGAARRQQAARRAAQGHAVAADAAARPEGRAPGDPRGLRHPRRDRRPHGLHLRLRHPRHRARAGGHRNRGARAVDVRRPHLGLLGAQPRSGPVQGPLARGGDQRAHGRHHGRLERHRPRRGREDRRRRRHPAARRPRVGEARGGQGRDRGRRRQRVRLHRRTSPTWTRSTRSCSRSSPSTPPST